MFEKLIPILLFFLPFVIFCYFWIQVHRFNKKKTNMDFLKVIYDENIKGTFPGKTPNTMQCMLSEKSINHSKQEEFIKRYKILYAWIVTYCLSTVLFSFLWIMYVVFIIFVCKATLSEVGVIFLVGSGILIFGMGMPPILKSFGGYKLKKLLT